MSKCRYCKLCEWANDGDKDFFGWCELRLDSYDIDEPRDCPDYIRASNADRIRAMSDEELAEELVIEIEGLFPSLVYVPMATGNIYISRDKAEKEMLEYLQQPAEEEKL